MEVFPDEIIRGWVDASGSKQANMQKAFHF